MTLRRVHSCDRCGDRIEPGDVYSAVDVLDADGDLQALLCRQCGRTLRDFLRNGGPGTNPNRSPGSDPEHGDEGAEAPDR